MYKKEDITIMAIVNNGSENTTVNYWLGDNFVMSRFEFNPQAENINIQNEDEVKELILKSLKGSE